MDCSNDFVAAAFRVWHRNLPESRFPFVQSICQMLGDNNAEELLKTESTYQQAQELFTTLISPRRDDYDVRVKEVIFTALISLNVLVRRPNPEEFPRIQKKLYIHQDSTAFKDVVENGGVVKYDSAEGSYGLVLEGRKEKEVSKLFGAIHYSFENETCSINSLKIHAKHRHKKYGSVLLDAAIVNALSQGIRKVVLASTSESISFYVPIGFSPMEVDQSKWQALSLEEKIAFAKTLEDRRFVLHIASKNS